MEARSRFDKAEKLADKTAAKREKDAAWADVDKVAKKLARRALKAGEDPRVPSEEERAAQELVRVHEYGGEAQALELAKSSERYPKIWRKK